MITDLILAGIAVGAVVARPRSWRSAAVAMACAVGAIALGAGSLGAALTATLPTIGFLLAAVCVAAGAVRLGAASVLASLLVRGSRGRPLALYALVCLTTAVATALVSLDGAVVLLVPVVLELARQFGAALRPLLLGVVAVANAFSLALPEGNPTNLVVLVRLGTSPGAYAASAFPAGLAAAVLCAAGVAWIERERLGDVHAGTATDVRIGSGLAAVLRLGVQLTSLLVLLIPAAASLPPVRVAGIEGALAVAGLAAACACLANNLPASAAVAAALTGPAALVALAGVSVGALGAEHGSVATLLAGDLAGARAYDRRLVPVVAAALAAATALLWVARP